MLLAGATLFSTALSAASLRESVFNEQIQKSGALGWEENKGGRSWKDSDIEGFNDFVDEVANGAGGLLLLKKWGIPHDCFDAIIGMHFVYSFLNGLVVDYGNGMDSISFAKRPASFIKKALGHLGTVNHTLLYPVSLKHKKNLSTGLIYVYAGRPGHAMILADGEIEGMFLKLEGPYPARHAKISKNKFFIDKFTVGAKFRRFPLYIRSGKKIKTKIPRDYPRDENQALSNSGLTWLQLYRLRMGSDYISMSTKNYIGNSFTESLCKQISTRIDRVNSGLLNCHFAMEYDERACSSNSSASYSTPSFDKSFKSYNDVFARLEELEILDANLLRGSTCGPLNINRNLSFLESQFFQFTLFSNNSSISLAPYLERISETNEDTIDPKKHQQYRWGCDYGIEGCLGIQVEHVPSSTNNFNTSDYITFLSGSQGLEVSINIPAQFLETIKYIVVESPDGGILRQKLTSSILNFKYSGRGMTAVYFEDQYGDQFSKEILVNL